MGAASSRLRVGSEVLGKSGTRYVLEKLLEKKDIPNVGVYLARAGAKKFIVKNVTLFDYKSDMYHRLEGSPCVRLLQDTVPDKSLFIFEYMTGHLLGLLQKDFPLPTKKRILRDALRGLKSLHDQNIFHADIKPNNIMIDYEEKDGKINVTRVQLTDLEDGAIVLPNQVVSGKQIGNWMWRSPEGHMAAKVKQYSDMFSFGVVCMSFVMGRVIFALNKEVREREGMDINWLTMMIQIFYFGKEDSVQALIKHIGDDSSFVSLINAVWKGEIKFPHLKPFSEWEGVDPVFRDLITSLTDLDPQKRITAEEALKHPWFEEVE